MSLRVVGTAIVTAILVSAFWIFWFGVTRAPTSAEVTVSGDEVVVDPKGGPPVSVAEGVTVGPAGLAIPVAGVKPNELIDTFTQARAGGSRALRQAADKG